LDENENEARTATMAHDDPRKDKRWRWRNYSVGGMLVHREIIDGILFTGCEAVDGWVSMSLSSDTHRQPSRQNGDTWNWEATLPAENLPRYTLTPCHVEEAMVMDACSMYGTIPVDTILLDAILAYDTIASISTINKSSSILVMCR